MKKIVVIGIIMGLCLTLTGCGCTKKEKNKENENNTTNNNEQTVVDDQIFEGLEFVNVKAKDGVIGTVVINNTGVKYEGSKFTMKIRDSKGNIIAELTDEVKEPMETGTTKKIETKTKVDLKDAVSIEYSLLLE